MSDSDLRIMTFYLKRKLPTLRKKKAAPGGRLERSGVLRSAPTASSAISKQRLGNGAGLPDSGTDTKRPTGFHTGWLSVSGWRGNAYSCGTSPAGERIIIAV